MITAWIGSFLLAVSVVINTLFVAGLPIGEFAMGGKYKVLPRKMRIACSVFVFIATFGILALMQAGGIFSIGLPMNAVKYIAYGFGLYFCINTIMNLFSKSNKERLIMTPLAAILACCFIFTAYWTL